MVCPWISCRMSRTLEQEARDPEHPVVIRNLRHDWGSVRALDGVSLTLPRGEITGLIGPDGAGKSTLMRIVLTLVNRSGGQVWCFGMDPSLQRRKIRDRFGYMPENFSLYPDLSVEENLKFSWRIHGASGRFEERRDRLYRFSRLGPFARTRAGHLSGGMKQKLALSCALMHDPELLVLDEPTTGVDPLSRREFWTMLQEIRGRGITLLVSTPYMDEAALCNRVALIHRGRILEQGEPLSLPRRIGGDLYELSPGTEDFGKWQKDTEKMLEGYPFWLSRKSLRVLVPGGGRLPWSSSGRNGGAVRVAPGLEDLFIYRSLDTGEAPV